MLFVHDPLPGADEHAAQEAAHGGRQRAAPAARRRPGPTRRSPSTPTCARRAATGRWCAPSASYAEYYERWSLAWEAQALLRAVPVAGDAELGERFIALVDPLRYPAGGLPDAAVREIRRIKARVEAERLPRGADPHRHLKLGRGGLADVEWTVQLLQLRHAGRLPALRTPSTLPALRAAADAGLVDPADAEVLAAAWTLASRVRNAVVLSRGRPSDSLPTAVRELDGIARLVGYPPGYAAVLDEDYQRLTRRARGVVERLFYG